jgi:type I restriction enzyme M protein
MVLQENTVGNQIDISALESHLWEAANILRGPVDAADFKTYVFPLLFFKRISDVYDEEYAVALEESGGDEEYASFPQNYRFQIPNGCRWSEVRAITSNVGNGTPKSHARNRKGQSRDALRHFWRCPMDQ